MFLNSIFIFLVSAPITINQSFTINPWSILINILFVPIITFLLFPILILGILIPTFSILGTYFITILEHSNQLLQTLPFSNCIIQNIPIHFVLLYYFCLFSYLKYKKIIFLCICFFVTFYLLFSPKFDKNAYIYFLDVQEGDSALLISPYQKEVLLIDTGSKSEYLKDNILTFIKSLGIKKLDYLILSHGDEDHSGNAITLLKDFSISNIILNQGQYNNIENEIRKKYPNKIRKDINTTNWKITKLNHSIKNNENDNSTILHTCIYQTCVLFMGDASKEVEQEILEKYQMKTNVLKVAHHGSKTSTSTEFLKNLKPQISIISSGKNNQFNHPHKEVINNLKKMKIIIKNTQNDGTILLKIKPKKYTIFQMIS